MRLSLEQIKDFAEKNRIQVWDIINDYKQEMEKIQGTAPNITNNPIVESKPIDTPHEELQQVKTPDFSTKGVNTEFSDILNVIQTQFKPEPVRDEKELENQLSQWLKAKYAHDSVQRQVQTSEGKVDIVLFGKYALELKIANTRNVLRDLIGQLRAYRRVYPNLAAVILDVREIEHSVIERHRAEYKADNIESIIVDGTLRKGKGRGGVTVNVGRR